MTFSDLNFSSFGFFRYIAAILTLSGVTTAYQKGVYRCPIFGGGFGNYGPFGSQYCGQESIFHYYTCCDYNPNECCMVLEAWVVVLLVIIGLCSLFCCFACCGACYYGVRRANKE